MLSLLLSCSSAPSADSAPAALQRVALIADTHLIDQDYSCCEGTDLDTESLQLSEARLIEAGRQLSALDPLPSALFVAGDVVHEFASGEASYYEQNHGAMDRAAEIFGALPFPVHLGLGNHDYDPPLVSRELTWELARSKWALESTYYAVDLHGFRFIVLDPQRGSSWDLEHPDYDTDYGSLGAEQLAWLDAVLAEGVPSFLILHYPSYFMRPEEAEGPHPDLFSVVGEHRDTIEAIFSGHMHLWMTTGVLWDPSAESEESARVRGWGLASTRYDARNWWILEIDEEAGTWRIPQAEEVSLASFFYDGQQPEGL